MSQQSDMAEDVTRGWANGLLPALISFMSFVLAGDQSPASDPCIASLRRSWLASFTT